MRLPKTTARGVCTVADLRDRSVIDPSSRCWVWQGGRTKGKAAMWTFDHARGEKRVMPGPLAVWNIAHGAAPLPGWLVFAGCGNLCCVNPAHMRDARDRAAYGAFVRRAGWLCGKHIEQKAASLAKARAAKGIRDTPPDVVEKVRQLEGISAYKVAQHLGIRRNVVYDIRHGRTFRISDGGAR